MSVNLQFAKLEHAYIRNVMVVPYIYIYFAQCCTVYVGLAQAHPNHPTVPLDLWAHASIRFVDLLLKNFVIKCY